MHGNPTTRTEDSLQYGFIHTDKATGAGLAYARTIAGAGSPVQSRMAGANVAREMKKAMGLNARY